MELLETLLARIPDATHFPTAGEVETRIEDLHRSARSITRLEVIGRSREGRPLSMLTVGQGDRHALVTGMPHPNEPLGTLGALALAELLIGDEDLRHELGFTWHIVPCVDPDGAALNYGWYGGPFSRETYATHVYRPPFDEQYEWTFSRADQGLAGLPWIPESAAVAAVIDRVRPALLVSMHNAEAGALYTLINRQSADYKGIVETVCDAVGLEVYAGAPEDDEPAIGPGLFLMACHLEGMLSSGGYAERYGTVAVINEPPMWRDPRCGDLTPAHCTWRDVDDERRQLIDELRSRVELWMPAIRSRATLEGVRGRALLAQLTPLEASATEIGRADPDSQCTVADVTSALEVVHIQRLRTAGHVLGFLADIESEQTLHSDLIAVREDTARALAEWSRGQADLEYVGLGAGVRAHVGIALEVARLIAPA